MSTMKDFTTAYDAIRKPSDGELTFSGWQKRTQDIRQTVRKTIEENEKIMDGLSVYYSESVIKERKAKLDKQNREAIAKAERIVQDDFDLVMSEKMKRLEVAHGAPSDEQLRLLQTLALRTKLDPAELAAAVPHVADNIQALRVLADTADRNGITFPQIPTERDIEENLETAREWCKIACDGIGRADDALGYFERLFWQTSDYGQFSLSAKELDSPVFLHVDEVQIIRKPDATDAAVADGEQA